MIAESIISKSFGASSIAAAGSGVYFAVTDAVAISGITSIAAVIMAGVSAYFAYKAKTIAKETHDVVNSRMTEFMEMAKKSFKAEGKIEGVQEEVAKQAIVDKTKAEIIISRSITEKQTTSGNREEKGTAVSSGGATVKEQLENIETVGEDTQERVKKIEGEIIK